MHTLAIRRASGSASRRIFTRDMASRVELLESRALLSASSILDGLFAQPSIDSSAVTNKTVVGHTPSQIRQAYGFNGITFGSDAVPGDGREQTIAIVDAYNDPKIDADLLTFDTKFGIAAPPSFTKLNQIGGSKLPATNAGWSQEIALDVEWAHAIAPKANILLVEANSNALSDLLAAVGVARNVIGVSVVSMSWASTEFSTETQLDQNFTTPGGHQGITFTASAGDNGAQALWPAVSPNVLSVGGTALKLSNGNYLSESAWIGSGGGTSKFELEPGFQQTAQSTGKRTSPDVAYDAKPATGVAVFDSVPINGRSGWFQIGGTSAGAPQWAALLAIANQGRVLLGQDTLSAGQAAIYTLPSTDFHDIATGGNGHPAKAGYDQVTGRGTPIAGSVISDLVGIGVATGLSMGNAVTTHSATPTSGLPDASYEFANFSSASLLANSASIVSGNLTGTVQNNASMPQATIALTVGPNSQSQAAITAGNVGATGSIMAPAASMRPATAQPARAIFVLAPPAGGALPDPAGQSDQAAASRLTPVVPGEVSSASPAQFATNPAPSLASECVDNHWALPIDNVLAALPAQLADAWDVDLAAIVLAIAVSFGQISMESRAKDIAKSHRRIGRLDLA